MLTLHPYLIFNGDCEKAFHFYEHVFGGEILFMGQYKDVPAETRPYFPGATDDQIMHASLQINPQTAIMGNDSVDTYQRSNGTIINNFFLYVNIDDQAGAYRIFDELAAGGKITMPMAPTFWSQHYGIVTDQFGISWKITHDAGQQQQPI